MEQTPNAQAGTGEEVGNEKKLLDLLPRAILSFERQSWRRIGAIQISERDQIQEKLNWIKIGLEQE